MIIALFTVLLTATVFAPKAPAYSATVTPIPPANGASYKPNESDTRVTVIYRYDTLQDLRERYLEGVTNGVPTNNGTPCRYSEKGRLFDKSGKEHEPSHWHCTGWGKAGSGRYFAVYQFPLREVPALAGRITLKAKVTNCKGWNLPISVVVRP